LSKIEFSFMLFNFSLNVTVLSSLGGFLLREEGFVCGLILFLQGKLSCLSDSGVLKCLSVISFSLLLQLGQGILEL